MDRYTVIFALGAGVIAIWFSLEKDARERIFHHVLDAAETCIPAICGR